MARSATMGRRSSNDRDVRMNTPQSPSGPPDFLREFALACRAERDRLALARLDAEDRRFESAHAERVGADLIADRAIAAARR